MFFIQALTLAGVLWVSYATTIDKHHYIAKSRWTRKADIFNPCSPENEAKGLAYHSHPSDLTKYIQCDNGQALERQCAPSTYWNSGALTCTTAQQLKDTLAHPEDSSGSNAGPGGSDQAGGKGVSTGGQQPQGPNFPGGSIQGFPSAGVGPPPPPAGGQVQPRYPQQFPSIQGFPSGAWSGGAGSAGGAQGGFNFPGLVLSGNQAFPPPLSASGANALGNLITANAFPPQGVIQIPGQLGVSGGQVGGQFPPALAAFGNNPPPQQGSGPQSPNFGPPPSSLGKGGILPSLSQQPQAVALQGAGQGSGGPPPGVNFGGPFSGMGLQQAPPGAGFGGGNFMGFPPPFPWGPGFPPVGQGGFISGPNLGGGQQQPQQQLPAGVPNMSGQVPQLLPQPQGGLIVPKTTSSLSQLSQQGVIVNPSQQLPQGVGPSQQFPGVGPSQRLPQGVVSQFPGVGQPQQFPGVGQQQPSITNAANSDIDFLVSLINGGSPSLDTTLINNPNIGATLQTTNLNTNPSPFASFDPSANNPTLSLGTASDILSNMFPSSGNPATTELTGMNSMGISAAFGPGANPNSAIFPFSKREVPKRHRYPGYNG